MKIVFDVDNCLVDFTKSFKQFCREQFPPHGIDMDETSYGLGMDPDVLYDMIKRWWASPAAGQVEFFPGAIDVFNDLAFRNDVEIVSSFPEEFREKREKNLAPLSFHRRVVLLPGNEKRDHIIAEKPDIAIEDKPDLIEAFARTGITVLFPRWEPYTRTAVDRLAGQSVQIHGFDHWDEVPGIIARAERHRPDGK